MDDDSGDVVCLCVCLSLCMSIWECWGKGSGWRWAGVEGEWKWEDTPCRALRLSRQQLHIRNFVTGMMGKTRQAAKEGGMCVMDEYIDGGNL